MDLESHDYEKGQRINTQTEMSGDDSSITHEVDLSPKPMRKAVKIKNIVLEEDYYALTWVSLKESTWKDKTVRGKSIFLTPSDYFWIHMNFIGFLVLLIITIILILWEVIEDRGYIASTWAIVILRITLVFFAQRALAPEFYQGIFLLRFSVRYPSFFTHHEFAVFIGACQLAVSCVVFCSIILFVCTEEEALNLVVEFAGLTVIANLDNWLGEVVMYSKCYDGDNDNKDYKLKDLNLRLSLYQKLALIEEEDMVMIDDQNNMEGAHWSIKSIEYLTELLPWRYCLPFITVVFNYVLPYLSPADEE